MRFWIFCDSSKQIGWFLTCQSFGTTIFQTWRINCVFLAIPVSDANLHLFTYQTFLYKFVFFNACIYIILSNEWCMYCNICMIIIIALLKFEEVAKCQQFLLETLYILVFGTISQEFFSAYLGLLCKWCLKQTSVTHCNIHKILC